MSAPDRDPFALARGDGADDQALTLFRQWIDAARAFDLLDEDDDDADRAHELLGEIEDQIMEMRGGAAVSLAIKTFFAARQDYACWAPDTPTLVIQELFDARRCWNMELAASMLRDAAAIVPEVAELAAPVIHDDAALIDAEINIRWCRERLAEPWPWPTSRVLGEAHDEKRRDEIEDKLKALLNRLATTEPKTDRGRAIILREGST
jgi:hypothetical protein